MLSYRGRMIPVMTITFITGLLYALWATRQPSLTAAQAAAILEQRGVLFNAQVTGDIVLQPYQYLKHNQIILRRVNIEGELNLQGGGECATITIEDCRMRELYLGHLEAEHVEIRQTVVTDHVNLLGLSFPDPARAWLMLDFKDSQPLVMVSTEAAARAVRLRHPTVPIACAVNEDVFAKKRE